MELIRAGRRFSDGFAPTFILAAGEELTEPFLPAQDREWPMAEDSTRRLLKVFGMAVTNLEDTLEAGQADGARKADAELRERMKEVIALVERLSERAAKL